MRLIKYLNEYVEYKERRSKELSLSKGIKLLKQNCKKSYRGMFVTESIPKIYRGMSKVYSSIIIVDPTKGEARQSANTQNYMTLLLDNLPSWKKYPLRSRSIICSTDKSYANEYGILYYVVPYDSAVIGVAPSEDIFTSFEKPLKYKQVYQFNDWFYNMIRRYKINEPKTYKELVKVFNKLSDIQLEAETDAYEDDGSTGYIDFEDTFNLFNTNDVMQHLNKILSPSTNKFGLGINNLKPNREVWIGGSPSILIDAKELDTIKLMYRTS